MRFTVETVVILAVFVLSAGLITGFVYRARRQAEYDRLDARKAAALMSTFWDWDNAKTPNEDRVAMLKEMSRGGELPSRLAEEDLDNPARVRELIPLLYP